MKKLAMFLAVLFVAYWLLLAHVSWDIFDNTPSVSVVSKDGKYTVFLKAVYPVNPIGIYCQLTTESPIFFELYDAKGDYVGQSSPFVCYGEWRDVPYRFPGEEFTSDVDSFVVFDDEYNGELNISTKQKKWWSMILSPFHSRG